MVVGVLGWPSIVKSWPRYGFVQELQGKFSKVVGYNLFLVLRELFEKLPLACVLSYKGKSVRSLRVFMFVFVWRV